jgi:regulation of enolase protein 1 (concanavalin A-like superfamily)
VVWVDHHNFLTVTRDEWVFDKKMRERFRGESCVTGRGRSDAEHVAAAPSGYVRVQRTGKRFEASHSTDGKTWKELNAYEAEWADAPKVGVVAENSFKAPFEVVFSEYTLTLAK